VWPIRNVLCGHAMLYFSLTSGLRLLGAGYLGNDDIIVVEETRVTETCASLDRCAPFSCCPLSARSAAPTLLGFESC
jgi:hypothetical protein